MYLSALSNTSERILGFLLNNLEKQYSIREIAKAIGQDYRIVFSTVKTLAKEKILTIKRVSNINQCSASLMKEHAVLFAYVSERFSIRKLPKRIGQALHDAVVSFDSPAYALLLFGSYAKGTATASSDIDLLFIVARKEQEKQIEAASRKAATLNNISIHTVVLTIEEFKSGLRQESVSSEAYKKHFAIKGGEIFYSLIGNA
jgi:predicted nucleotidyltransferase